jgi:hypothetical protein
MIMAGALMLSSSVMRGVGEDDRMPELAEEAFGAKDCAKWIRMQMERSEELTKNRRDMS